MAVAITDQEWAEIPGPECRQIVAVTIRTTSTITTTAGTREDLPEEEPEVPEEGPVDREVHHLETGDHPEEARDEEDT